MKTTRTSPGAAATSIPGYRRGWNGNGMQLQYQTGIPARIWNKAVDESSASQFSTGRWRRLRLGFLRVDLIALAYQNGLSASRRLYRGEQKSLGQFMTPPAIARLMASRACSGFEQNIVRVLDPAAGSGVLAAAIFERLLRSPSIPDRIDFVLCEYDARLKPSLNTLAREMRAAGETAGSDVRVSIVISDFLLSPLACDRPQFDIVIANPPYFKLAKSDPRSVKHDYAVYGQPNIYGLFMAACSRLVNEGGRWCFITPRSWTSGCYFANARRQIRFHLHIDAMHIFESRQHHFTDDEVLQEAMITWATAQAGKQESIVVSSSQGVRDLDRACLRKVPASDVIGVDTRSVIHLPSHEKASSQPFTATLGTYGMKASTGPVVAFSRWQPHRPVEDRIDRSLALDAAYPAYARIMADPEETRTHTVKC